jgi:hypothetical protein
MATLLSAGAVQIVSYGHRLLPFFALQRRHLDIESIIWLEQFQRGTPDRRRLRGMRAGETVDGMRRTTILGSLLSLLLLTSACKDTKTEPPAAPVAPAPTAKTPESKPESKAPAKDPCENLCMDRGECTFQNGKCVVGGDDDCQKKSRACRMYGRCTAKDGKCTAASDEDCKKSQKCTSFKECTAKNGECEK